MHLLLNSLNLMPVNHRRSQTLRLGGLDPLLPFPPLPFPLLPPLPCPPLPLEVGPLKSS